MVTGDLWNGKILRVNHSRKVSRDGGRDANRAVEVAAGTDVMVAEFCDCQTCRVPVQLNGKGLVFFIERPYLNEGGADAAG